jgi:hypothetical protein
VNKKNKTLADDLSAGQLLEIGQPYWIQCKNIRCLAVFDQEGKWKASYSGNELSDVINFFPINVTAFSKLQTWSIIPVEKTSISGSANANSL